MIQPTKHRQLLGSMLILVGYLALAGCASTIGMAEPVIPTNAMVALARGSYGIEAVLAADTGDTVARRRRRDQFIAVQLATIDARYGDFTRNLSREMKEGNVTLELGVIALTSAGSIAGPRLANLLSAAGAGLSGSKAAINRELYAERALSAIIATMDAARLTIKTRIISRMREKSIDEYSVAESIADLSAYEHAASLDSAVDDVVATAVVEKQQAKAEYDRVVGTCKPEKDVGAQWFRVAKALQKLNPATDEPKLDTISAIVGSDAALPFVDQRDAIIDKIGLSYCTIAQTGGLIERITSETGIAIP